MHFPVLEVAQETVELDSRVRRPREATSSQRAGGHVKVASVLLSHYVCGRLAGPECDESHAYLLLGTYV